MRRMATRDMRTGQSLVECALVIPLLLVMIVNVVNFGGLFYVWIAVANAARTGVQYYSTLAASTGASNPPSAAAVQAFVVADLVGLPNSSSVQVCVSMSNSATVTCNTGAAPASAPAADTPEGTAPNAITYVMAAVDVSYPYQPFVPGPDFTSLLVTTIQRRGLMRVLQ